MANLSSSKKTENKSGSRPGNLTQRAFLVVALWLGFWILALGLVAGLAWIPLAQINHRSTIEFSGIVAGIAALTLAYTLRPRRKEKKSGESVKPLSRDTAAPLYAMVERIGKELGVSATVNIHLIGGATAFISGNKNWLGRIKSLEVGLGLPLLGTLSEAELGSVIAHEYGHFVAGDLSLGPWVYRTRISIARTVTDLDDSMFFLDILFRWYGKWFLRLSAAVSREQEYAADATAAKKFGPVATRSALEKVHLISPLWSSYLDYELGPALNRGARMPIFEGFRRFCKPGIRRAEIQEAIHYAEAHESSEYDTHPSMEERVAAVVPGARPGMPPLAQCLHLLGGEQQTEDAWYSLFEVEQLTVSDWDNYAADVMQAINKKRFEGSWMDPKVLPLSELKNLALDPDSLWDRLRPEGVSFLSRLGKRQYVLEIMEAWISACLTQYGYRASLIPGQALVMTRADGSVQPATLLQTALLGHSNLDDLKRMEQSPGTSAVTA
ncbi:M48 family metallopeptidase [Undibacterium sp. TS12]|uniref:M48 family metalloprotease n=1 Tax=Undibacterium sp. TS12 TaxID=2908202 RepID=UPI001F4CE6F8|nr:M48 family metallopeptidase [Undibacterium sp. TS12]MCH8620846.1 M48 family metalloprotease [Undibacterium sp. TS12]